MGWTSRLRENPALCPVRFVALYFLAEGTIASDDFVLGVRASVLKVDTDGVMPKLLGPESQVDQQRSKFSV